MSAVAVETPLADALAREQAAVEHAEDLAAAKSKSLGHKIEAARVAFAKAPELEAAYVALLEAFALVAEAGQVVLDLRPTLDQAHGVLVGAGEEPGPMPARVSIRAAADHTISNLLRDARGAVNGDN